MLKGPARVICVAHGYEDDAVFVKFVGSRYDDDGWMDGWIPSRNATLKPHFLNIVVWCLAGK